MGSGGFQAGHYRDLMYHQRRRVERGCLSSLFSVGLKRSDSRKHSFHDWWVQISVHWIDIMCDDLPCWLFQEEMMVKILQMMAVIPITPSFAMTLSKTSGQLLAKWGTRDKLMPWQSWTETLLSIGATSDNWGRGQYGYDSKYQGVDTNHLYQHGRLRLWPVILPKWLNKNKKVNKNWHNCFGKSNIFVKFQIIKYS